MTLLLFSVNQFTSKFFRSVCQLFENASVLASTFYSQTDGQVKRYDWPLTAILHCYVNDHQQDCDGSAFTVKYVYDSQVHHCTNPRPFDLVRSWMIPNFTLRYTVSTKYNAYPFRFQTVS